MRTIIETERLKIREFDLDDAGFVMQLTNTEDWLRNIGDRNTGTIELAREYIENGSLKSYRERGYGGYMVELKDTGEPVGMCGLFKREMLDHPDIGFAFLPQHYGKGFGFEAASSVKQYAFEELRLSKLMGITLPSNQPSISLLQKLGLNFVCMMALPGDTDELMVFST